MKCVFFSPISLDIHLTVALFAFKKFLHLWLYQCSASMALLIGNGLWFLCCACWKSKLHSTVVGCHFYSFLRWSRQWQCSQGGVFMLIKSSSLPFKKKKRKPGNLPGRKFCLQSPFLIYLSVWSYRHFKSCLVLKVAWMLK